MARAQKPARSEPACSREHSQDPHQALTNRIIADLQAGVRPWVRPWADGGIGVRPLRHDGQPYHGANVLTLWAEAALRHYTAPVWMTFRQAAALGGAVRKGERGVRVVYANRLIRPEPDGTGQDHNATRPIAYLKSYTVFNLAQTTGLDDRYPTSQVGRLDSSSRLPAADAFFAATGAVIGHGGSHAYYAPGPDRIQMPPFETFIDPESYYATLAHEMTHWTRHPTRLDRDCGRRRFGDEAYAREELVAELGAAFLCADLELTLAPRPDHAAYLSSWLQVLRGEKRFIFSAAAHAERAVAFLMATQTPPRV